MSKPVKKPSNKFVPPVPVPQPLGMAPPQPTWDAAVPQYGVSPETNAAVLAAAQKTGQLTPEQIAEIQRRLAMQGGSAEDALGAVGYVPPWTQWGKK